MTSYLFCNTCTDELYKYKQKQWRFGCAECAEHHKEFHEAAFPGHVVSIVEKDEKPFESLREQLRRGA